MPSLNDQVAQIEAALAALAAQRPALGDAVVDITLATLRAQLDALRQPSSSSPLAGMRSLGGQLDQLRQAELIRLYTLQPELEFIFTHSLTQQAAYDSMLYATRQVIHRTVAQTYEHLYAERLDEFAALLAHHYAEARDDTKSAEYAIRAGNLASHANAQTEARLHYAQALDALSRLPDDDQNRRWRLDALLNQMWVATFSEPPAVQLERLDEAEALARRLPETDSAVQRQVAQIYHFKGFMHLITNRPREALHYFNAARTLSQTLGDGRVLAIATASIGVLLSSQGRFSAAEPFIRDGIDLMRKAGVPLDQVSPVSTLGWIVAAQGNYAAGQAEAEQGILLAQQAHNPSAIEVGYSLLAEIYWMGRDIPHMLEASRACLAMAETNHDIVWMNVGYCYVAWAQSYLGQHEEALANLTRARAIGAILKGQLSRRDWLTAAEAEIAWKRQQAEEAIVLAAEAIELARAGDSLSSAAVAQRVWGCALATQTSLGGEDAEAHLMESLRLFELGSARIEAAHTRVALGELYAARGNARAAHGHLAQAATQFEASGLVDALARTHRLIAMLH